MKTLMFACYVENTVKDVDHRKIVYLLLWMEVKQIHWICIEFDAQSPQPTGTSAWIDKRQIQGKGLVIFQTEINANLLIHMQQQQQKTHLLKLVKNDKVALKCRKTWV